MPPGTGSMLCQRNTSLCDIVFFVDEAFQIVAVDRGAQPEENAKYVGTKLSDVLHINASTIAEELNNNTPFRTKMPGSDVFMEFTPLRILNVTECNKSKLHAVFMGKILDPLCTPTPQRRLAVTQPTDEDRNNNNNNSKKQKLQHSESVDILPLISKDEFQPLFPEFPQSKIYKLLQARFSRFSSVISCLQI